jgi:hypothetical protein
MRRWQRTIGMMGLAVAISGAPVSVLAAAPAGDKISANPVRNYPGPETITVNGKSVTFDQGPVMVDGTLMVPLRAIIEAAGGDVQWEMETQTARVHLGPLFSSFTLGRDAAELRKVGVFYIKPNMIQMQHATTMVESRMLIAADALTTILGFTVKPAQYTSLDLTWGGD